MPSRRKVKKTPKPWLWWCLGVMLAWTAGHFLMRPVDGTFYWGAGRYVLQWGEGESAQLLQEGEEPELEEIRERQSCLVCPPVGTLELSGQALADSFADLPRSPMELGSLLSYINSAGVQVAGVSSPLIWDTPAGAMGCNMMGTALGKFKAAVLGMRGRTAGQADFTPAGMREFIIPPENLTGDSRGIPSANRALPNGLADVACDVKLPWAPDWLEDEPHTREAPSMGNISFPLIVRWNSTVIPTIPLYLAMKAKGLQPSDIHIVFGKEIRIKDRVLPLDEHGRTRMDPATHRIIPLQLSEVVGGGGANLQALGKEAGACVLIGEPVEEPQDPEGMGAKAHVQEGPAEDSPETKRLRAMAHTLAELMGERRYWDTVSYRPLGGRVLREAPVQRSLWTLVWVLVLLPPAFLILPLLPTLPRRILLLAAVPVWMVYIVYRNLQEGYWMSFSAMQLAWNVLMLGVHCLKKPARDPHSRCRHV